MKTLHEMYLAKARKAVKGAVMLEKGADFEASISRSYYAMFYAAKALLLRDGLTFKKHSGIISAFGERYAKTGLVPPEYGRRLKEAFNWRISCDYEVDESFTRETALGQIKFARTFIKTVAAIMSQEALEPG